MVIKQRWDLINYLVHRFSYDTYLEIGVETRINFLNIDCGVKVSVDPNVPKATYRMTSDDYFSNIEEYEPSEFDIIFVDGLHHADQVYRDIENSLSVLYEGGTIVCHDMNPQKCTDQIVPQHVQNRFDPSPMWMGDCWKAWVKLRTERSDLQMTVLQFDTGCGIIRRGKQELLNLGIDLDVPKWWKRLRWRNFCKHRKEWLNLVHGQQLPYLFG